MRLSLDDGQRAFREQAERFVAASWPPEDPSPRAEVDFRIAAVAAGLLAADLPIDCGGRGAATDAIRGSVWQDACRRAGAPGKPAGTGVQMLVPTLLEAGSAEQRRRFLLSTVTGAEIWAQGFSEPGAGSDLASLRTRATLDGDEWVIDGQKIWTTHAERADWIFALVRTEPDAPPHRGISFLLIPATAPGVIVRPIRQMTGEHEYCEVFLDGVRVPADHIVGGRGEGWRIANLLLKHERGWIGDFIGDRFDQLVALFDRTSIDGTPARGHPDLVLRLMEIEGRVMAHHASALRRITATAESEPPSLIDHVAKLYATGVMDMISALVRDLVGHRLLGPCDDPWGGGPTTPDGYWVRDWYWSMAYAIAGGASNVQRDVIALRGLGLARPGKS